MRDGNVYGNDLPEDPLQKPAQPLPSKVSLVSRGRFVRDYLERHGEATQVELCNEYKRYCQEKWAGWGIKVPRYLKTTYHSFAMFFNTLRALGWVEPSGREEPSQLQERSPEAPSKVYYRLTQKGLEASIWAWSDPFKVLYPDTR